MRPPIRVLFSTAILLGAAYSCAQFVVRSDQSSVSLNGVHVVTLHPPRVSERVQAVVASLRKLTTKSKITIKGSTVLDGTRTVLTATNAEAKAHGMTPKALASTWAGRLKSGVAVPPISVGFDKLRTGLGSVRKVPLEGYMAPHAKAESSNAAVVFATVVEGTLKITGKALGQAVIAVKAGSVTKTIQIDVLPNAMNFPQNVTVGVTGSPATASEVKAAIETAMWTLIRHNPGAQYKFKMPDSELLEIGISKSYAIGVDASCAGAISNSGIANVTVQNVPVGFRQERSLWYCNDPESVKGPGELFAAHLVIDQPVRMLYHHQNDSNMRLFVQIEARNESEMPARVLLMPGDAEPSKDPVRAGVEAGEKLLRSWVRNSGEIVTIPPRSSIIVAMRSLGNKDTMSGLTYLRLLQGPKQILVKARAQLPYDGDARLAAGLECAAPWRRIPPMPLGYTGHDDVEQSEHIYPNPFKTETVSYTVGGRHGFVRIGQQPIQRPDGHGLDGNFGVFYTIEATLDNPGETDADIEFVFEASAGYSSAIFVVDGAVRRSPMLQSKEEVQVARIKLKAGEQKSVTISTVPLSGSSYPATLIVRPVGSGAKTFVRKIDHLK